MTTDTLAGLYEAGYVTDEWRRWQQGQCGTYALALLSTRPGLKAMEAGRVTDDGFHETEHFYVTDGTWAYDSAGRHPMPYLGIDGRMEYAEETCLAWYGIPEDETGPEDAEAGIADALDHARRNGILALMEPAAQVTAKDIIDFTYGGCYLLAEEIEAATGWGPAAFWDGFRPAGHVFAAMPDGRFLDITGAHTRAEMMATHWARPGDKHGRRGITRNVGSLDGWRLERRYEDELRARARELIPVLLAELGQL